MLNRQTNFLQEIIRHPTYKSNLKYDDIALLRLAEDIQFTNLMRPACLRTVLADVDPMQELFITGWGRTDASRKF